MNTNVTRHCGILPAVHKQYGYEKERVNPYEYPWQVAIMDTYYNYKCGAGLIGPRHVITSSYCVKGGESDVRVRIGEFDLSTDRNYLETYKNTEYSVCKIHRYYNGELVSCIRVIKYHIVCFVLESTIMLFFLLISSSTIRQQLPG